ncbi:MAG: zinc-binding dehydrogenase, partial [Armatimonadetes bacterium]|nr:zinc-binding dehydrogenase [Armatimonadota bacterium]
RKAVFERVEVPPPGDEEVLVRTTWSWISNGTEGSFLRGERANGETPASTEQPAPFPIVPGYQRVGEVVAAGRESGFEPGQRVFVTISRCEGMAVPFGGHLHVAPAHASQVRRLPSGGPAEEAYAGLVLTQVGYNCGSRPELSPGDAALVIGDGMVGQWAAQTLRHCGARVLLLGRHDERLARFDRGANDRVVNTKREDAGHATAEWAPEGLQVLVDTVGSNETVEALFMHLRHYGQIVSAGYLHDRGKLDVQLLRFREAALYAPSGWAADRLDATLAGVREGWLQTLPLVTDRLPATEVAEAWRRIFDERDRTLGVLLDWREVTA